MKPIQFIHLQAFLNQYGEQLQVLYKKNLASEGSNKGELYKTVEYEVKVNQANYLLEFDFAGYFIYAEDGRGPGKMPPYEPIAKWVKSKPVAPTMQNGAPISMESLTYLIRRKIGREGTKGNHLWAVTLDEVSYLEQIDDAIQLDVEVWINSIL